MNPNPIRRSMVLAALSAPAWAAAAWPTKPVRIVLPFASGGSSDVVARLLADKLTASLGKPVIIEAKPGANGIIATEAVFRSTDGHTLLMTSAAHAINASLYPKLPYDSLRDFAPVSMVASPGPLVLAVHSGLPVKNLAELIELAKREPGTLSYASAGIGNVLHLAGEMLSQQAGVQLLHVPYKGAAPALNDLAGGQVKMMFNSALALAPMVKDGRVRLLAQTGDRRSAALPSTLPTVAETRSLGGFQISAWFGLLAPASLPSAAVGELNAACVAALAQPDMMEKLALLGSAEPAKQTPQEFGSFLSAEIGRYSQVVKSAGLKLDQP
ncbi:tripartite-type tricarboxylate transporter receptor subunit TctC [Acidovorax sp. 69]|uniref:tripartite tricarboxylate transporter substrate binding protein n=1 Tax=Acidovorax sp. 69 TaxID=2035202 RepID=UPI000C240072|nr:tripartite tricarboxylate transporter substrate binding protein [Acidovorax sp. 69]PJI95840.1 tripartite-type tricarboxylate transporter receptor subunit TctC [Acidovorax sp. 69]